MTERELAYVLDAARHGWYDQAGEWNQRFERAFAARHQSKHAFTLPSCTAGLHLSLAALGVGPGDEVIIPDVTWIATAAPVTYLGATPIFADIDPVTWCIDPSSVERCITDRTRAIIGVDLYGGICDWAGLAEVARPRGIALVEDAAEAIGSTFEGRAAGTFADVGCFSFHGSKTMTTGEGGMLITERDDIADKITILRDHGRAPGDKAFYNRMVGFKYRMSQLQAAFGLAQLERLDDLVAHKREIFSAYSERLAGVPGITLNAEPQGLFNSYWMSTVVFSEALGIDKEEFLGEILARGIDARPFFYPLSALPAFVDRPEAARARRENVVSHGLSYRGVNLPSAAALDPSEVAHIADVVVEILEQGRSGVRKAPQAASPRKVA